MNVLKTYPIQAFGDFVRNVSIDSFVAVDTFTFNLAKSKTKDEEQTRPHLAASTALIK